MSAGFRSLDDERIDSVCARLLGLGQRSGLGTHDPHLGVDQDAAHQQHHDGTEAPDAPAQPPAAAAGTGRGRARGVGHVTRVTPPPPQTTAAAATRGASRRLW